MKKVACTAVLVLACAIAPSLADDSDNRHTKTDAQAKVEKEVKAAREKAEEASENAEKQAEEASEKAEKQAKEAREKAEKEEKEAREKAEKEEKEAREKAEKQAMEARAKAEKKAEEPWDIAFGTALLSDYIFRGISASDHRPAVSAYFEPHYDFSSSLQAYAHVETVSLALLTDNAAAVELLTGVRPTFDRLALDFGFWEHWLPGGQCINIQAPGSLCIPQLTVPFVNSIPGELSFWEVYGKATYYVDRQLSFGGQVFWTPTVLNTGAEATYAAGWARYVLPPILPKDFGWFISAEVGHWFRDTSPYPSYTNWNAGLVFTWKQFTLGLRYSDTDRQDCLVPVAFLVHTSTRCGPSFIARLAVDLTKANVMAEDKRAKEVAKADKEWAETLAKTDKAWAETLAKTDKEKAEKLAKADKKKEEKLAEADKQAKTGKQAKEAREKAEKEAEEARDKVEKEAEEAKEKAEKGAEEAREKAEKGAEEAREKAENQVARTPWDIAFGGALMSDYNFRGISASDHRPAVSAYFEPHYDFSRDLQAYVNVTTNSVRLPNGPPTVVEIYGGVRPTFDRLAMDFGVWEHWFPTRQCFNFQAPGGLCIPQLTVPFVNSLPADISFLEVFGRGNYYVDSRLSFGGGVYWTPSVLDSGAQATYVASWARYVLPPIFPKDFGWFVSAEAGHWFRDTSPFPSYTNWNAGLAFTWKRFTLDLRYSDTDRHDCAVPVAAIDHTSNRCGASFVARLGFDLTKANLTLPPAIPPIREY
jgi:flagellar biosynthesis GTPase FlhF